MMEVLIVREEDVLDERRPAPSRRWPLALCCALGPFMVIMFLNIFYSKLISPALYQDSTKLVFQYDAATPGDAVAAKTAASAKPGSPAPGDGVADKTTASAKPEAVTVVPDGKMFLPARDYAGHVAYAITSAFLAIAALATFVFSTALVVKFGKWSVAIVAVPCWTGVSWAVATLFTNVHGRHLVVHDLLNAADAFSGLGPFVILSHGRPVPTGQLMENLVFINTFFTLIPVGMLLTVLVVLSWRPPMPLTEQILLERRFLLRCLLWFASALFVIGVLCNKALVEWPLTLIKADQALALTPIANSLVLQFGALGSAAIFAAFAPAIAAWTMDAITLRRAVPAKSKHTDALQFAPTATVMSFIAVVAPLLASPVADSLKSVLGALSK